MYKITYLPTGHIFELPDEAAQELKSKFPYDYKILEKNGKKFCDRMKKKNVSDKTILSKVIDTGEEK